MKIQAVKVAALAGLRSAPAANFQKGSYTYHTWPSLAVRIGSVKGAHEEIIVGSRSSLMRAGIVLCLVDQNLH